MRAFAFLTVALVLTLPVAGHAAGLSGTWERSNGHSRVTFAPCGSGTCGHISWLKPGVKRKAAKVGDRVFFDMVRTGDGWSGKAFNPADGKTYSGNIRYEGAKLVTKGCVLGGLVCKSDTWTRVN